MSCKEKDINNYIPLDEKEMDDVTGGIVVGAKANTSPANDARCYGKDIIDTKLAPRILRDASSKLKKAIEDDVNKDILNEVSIKGAVDSNKSNM